jgi:hypothetical protein
LVVVVFCFALVGCVVVLGWGVCGGGVGGGLGPPERPEGREEERESKTNFATDDTRLHEVTQQHRWHQQQLTLRGELVGGQCRGGHDAEAVQVQVLVQRQVLAWCSEQPHSGVNTRKPK